MKTSKLTLYSGAVVLIILAMLVSGLQPAHAQDPEPEIQVTGEVTAIDSLAGTLIVQSGDLGFFTILYPADFDVTQLRIGSEVEVEGALNPDGTITASQITVLDDDQDEEELVELTGEVTGIDASTASMMIQTDDGTLYTVYLPADFDITTLMIGDMVEIEGTTNPDGTINANSVTIEDASDEELLELTGEVVAIDSSTNSFTVQTQDGTLYTVILPDGFDITELMIGDIVEVEGQLNPDGTVSAVSIRIEDDEDDEDDPNEGYYCRQSEDQHPFGARLAARYSVEYETLQAFFCDGMGWGQIMLALQTGQITGEDPATYLDQRREGTGWGEIWQSLGLIGNQNQADSPADEDGNGRPDHAGPPNDEDGDGKPDHAGPPNDEDGNGKPDHAGPPNDEDGDGKPDHAGPPKNKKGKP